MGAGGENALTRAIRMRLPDEALYWYFRCRDGGTRPDRLGRRLFISACRDNLDIPTLIQAERNMHNAEDGDRPTLVLALASSQKLWSDSNGQALVQLIVQANRDRSLRDLTENEILLRMEAGFEDDRRFMQVVLSVAELLNRWRMFKSKGLDRMVDWLGVCVRHTDVFQVYEVFLRNREILLAAPMSEETLLFLLATWGVTGIWGQSTEGMDTDLAVSRAGRRRRREEAGAVPEDVPTWAANEDKRFDADWLAYLNMTQMLKQYGRMDPNDEGVLLRTKGGEWKPDVHEEDNLYMVQSQSDPFKYYEVSLASAVCNCVDFQRRGGICKHQIHAKRYAESQMPFEIV